MATGNAPNENKKIVLEAFDTLFNRRDFEKAATFWSPDYIQHSAHIEPDCAPADRRLTDTIRGRSNPVYGAQYE